MAKHWRFGLLGVLVLLLAPATAFAGDNINVGDTIRFSDACTGCSTQGGPFWLDDTTTGERIETFCVELNEHISFNTNYLVGSIGAAVNGGAVGTPVKPDPISWETAALYLMYRDGTLAGLWDSGDGSGFGVLSNFEKDVVQAFFWIWEEALAAPSFGVSQAMITEANGGLLAAVNANGNVNAQARVAAVNPVAGSTQKQSQLMMVPEPATLLLLGTGLLGLGLANRRRIKG